MSSLLFNKSIPLNNRASIYCACVRPVMLYGAETWATTKTIKRKICSYDQRMLRYMAHVQWEDRATTRRCGIRDIIDVLKRNRSR